MSEDQRYHQGDGAYWQWEAPRQTPEPPKKRNKAVIVLSIIAGVLFLVLLGSMLEESGSATQEQSSSAEPTQESTPEPAATTPEETEEPTPEVTQAAEERDPFSGDLTYEETTLILDMVWAGYSSGDRADVCTAVALFGMDGAYEEFSAGFAEEDGSTIDEDAFIDFFTEKC